MTTWPLPENGPLVEKILALRYQIATKLGYQNWADYQIEVKMAKNGATAIEFERETARRPAAEVRRGTGGVSQTQGGGNRRRERADQSLGLALLRRPVEEDEIQRGRRAVARITSRCSAVLDGMFTIYQRIFGLKFERVDAPYKWVDDLQLWAVTRRARPASRWAFSISTCSRAKANTITSPCSRSLTASASPMAAINGRSSRSCAISRRRPATSLRCLITTRWKRCSTNSATRCTRS